jgi:outer membrane protein assembly factor BamB
MNAAPRFGAATLALVALLLFGAYVLADWPSFRGANGGVADARDIPAEWTKDNLLWKTKLPGLGASSPIVVGDKVFVACYAGYGTTLTKGMSFGGGGFGKKGGGGFGKKKGGGFGGFGGADTGGDQKKLKLLLVCLESRKGEVLWKKEVEPKLPEAPFSGFMREHGYASNTPVSDGQAVYVFFGKTGVIAYDLNGKQLWQKSVGTKTHMWGSAASPIIVGDKVIVNAAIESGALVALDKKTGDEVWRTKGVGTSWSSPALVKTKEGKYEVVVSQPSKIVAYDPENGKQLWFCKGITGGGFSGGYTITTPVSRDGIIYTIGGGGPSPTAAIAVKAGGRGDVNDTHVLWRKSSGTSTASPVLCGNYLVWVAGSVTCLNIADGTKAHSERLYNGFGEYCSPVAVGDKVFAPTRFDGVYVVSVGDKVKKLAHNEFKDDDSIINSSPAVSDNRLYIRSNTYLYCIGNQSEK